MMAYNPADDAKRLRDAMKGLGTNDSVLIDIIGHRTRQERMMIVSAYSSVVGRNLLSDVEAETSGNYRTVLRYLLKPRDEMLAELLHLAMDGAGTKDRLLIDLMTQFPYELPAVAAAYQRLYKKSLEAAIKADTSGNYEKLLCALLNIPRPPPSMVDPYRAAADADAFYRAGEGKIGTDEDAYINILASNSYQQLMLIDQNYRQKHPKGMIHAVKSETSGRFEDAMVALLTPPDEYFAARIKQSVDGAGTNDDELISCFVCNERPQLQMIGKAFERLYKKNMAKRVADDVSGDYKRILMALL